MTLCIMKSTFVYSMRTEIIRLSVAFTLISAYQASHILYHACPEILWILIWGLQINFSEKVNLPMHYL